MIYHGGGDLSVELAQPAFREIILERVRCRYQMKLSPGAIAAAKLSVVTDAAGSLFIHLDASIWADPPKSIACEWPATWWEHFKQRWFPKWAIRRWPVRMERRALFAQMIYPNLVTEHIDHLSHLKLCVKKK